VTLLAFAAVVRRAAAAPLLLGAGRATVDRYFTPGPQQQTRRTSLQHLIAGTDG